MKSQTKIKHGLLLLALASHSSEGFAVRTKRSRTNTGLQYRVDGDTMTTAIHPSAPSIGASYLVTNPLLQDPLQEKKKKKLPSWLGVERSHLVDENLTKLKQHMLSSFYTESEASKLLFALDEASLGDANKKAGAAEFCLILVDTMEMGLSTLIAAAFHYCSCVEAREKEGVWDPKEHQGLQVFGSHAKEIARDAARLKKMEMVFSSIVPNPLQDADNLRNLLLTDTRDWRALAMRSAACLFRLRNGGDKRAAREALYIFAPLASRLGMHRLKNELEDAAFKTLYKRQYETVTSLARQMRYKKFERGVTRRSLMDDSDESLNIGESMKCVLESVQQDMEEVLRSDPVFMHATSDFHVSARVKEPYSLWRKMLRNRVDDVLQVPDALALRVVLNAKKMSPDEDDSTTRARERALCYYAQQKCTDHWAPLGRFKDYVKHPKPNGYQSLHYTASTEWQDEDWTLEIQIRSGEMHKVAEYGLASHWDYKSKTNGNAPPATTDYSSDSYTKHVQEWHWEQRAAADDLSMNTVERHLRAERIRKRNKELAPYLEALTTAQSQLVANHVFVFRGHNIVALPSGARVQDAWAPELGRPFLNGQESSLNKRLRNGDLLTAPSMA